MRKAFVSSLMELAKRDSRLMLIVGDVGLPVIDPFMQQFPQQFLNAGIAEQNMMGLAVGLTFSGRTVFVYSIGNFTTLRCLEQIRNDACYHRANVKIVSVGGGMAYGTLSMSHHATEDIAAMRSLPYMTVVVPGDPIEAFLATREVAAYPGPCYLRLGLGQEPNLHPSRDIEFELGKAITMRQGSDVALLATGGLLANAMAAAEKLEEYGLHARVLSLHTVKPLDVEAVMAAASETKAVFTVEEHNIVGGLGSAVAEALLESRERPRVFRRIGLRDVYPSKVGDQAYLQAQYGLDAPGIVQTVMDSLQAQER